MELLSVDADNIETLNHLANCFRLALDSATEEMNRKVALKYVSVLQEEGKHKVEIYELMFFRATDFKYLDGPSRAVIKAHLIASMRKKLSQPLINVCEGIGAYLDDANEVESFLGALLPPILSQNDGLCAAAIERLYYEKQNMSAERKNWLDARIAKLKSLYGNAKRDLFVKALDELELVLLDVPF
jgi:hypothetical protein